MIPILILLAILALMWQSDRIIGWFRGARPNRQVDEKRNNLDLFGPVDVSKTKSMFDDL